MVAFDGRFSLTEMLVAFDGRFSLTEMLVAFDGRGGGGRLCSAMFTPHRTVHIKMSAAIVQVCTLSADIFMCTVRLEGGHWREHNLPPTSLTVDDGRELCRAVFGGRRCWCAKKTTFLKADDGRDFCRKEVVKEKDCAFFSNRMKSHSL